MKKNKEQEKCHSHQGCHNRITSNENETSSIPAGFHQSEWFIKAMDCPAEVKIIKDAFKKQENIIYISSNLLTKKVKFAYKNNEHLNEINILLKKIGLPGSKSNDENNLESHTLLSKIEKIKLTVSGILAFCAEWAHFQEVSTSTIVILSLLSILLLGSETLKSGINSIKNKKLNINALMSIAVIGAIAIGQWPEAAMVLFLYTLSETLEAYSLHKTRKSITHLLKMTPETIRILKNNTWKTIQIKSAKIDDIAEVKPGERIALDGMVIKGESTVNQAPITGESTPIPKNIGDNVFAGSINELGNFQYKITSEHDDTTLARIVKILEEAQSKQTHIEKFVDKFAQIYIPIIISLAVIIGFIFPLFLGDWSKWFYNALVLLVISCPCALLISTPVTLITGMRLAAKQGILIKGGEYLELVRKIKWLGIDKTGTITHGFPKEVNFTVFNQDHKKTIHYAYSLATLSNHPLSKALVKERVDNHIEPITVSDFQTILGIGVKGIIEEKMYYLVNNKYLDQLNLTIDTDIMNQIHRDAQKGSSLVIFCNEEQVLAYFVFQDIGKKEVKQVIQDLKSQGIVTAMITGDNQYVANSIAHEIGIEMVYSEQLPEEKLSVIEKASQKHVTAMIGDGINDTPALARAHIGIAMGKLGTDITLETADIIFTDDHLEKITDLIKISKVTFKKLRQNIIFAIAIKVIFIILAMFSLSHMWMAIFADVGATLLVILNGYSIMMSKWNRLP